MNKYLMCIAIWMCTSSALAQTGEWEVPVLPFGVIGSQTVPPIVPVHLIHLHTGKVLAITYAGFDQPCDPSCTTVCVARIYLWTPPPIADPGDPGDFEDMHHCRINLFCAGHSALADGRILTVGGDRSTPSSFAG